MLFDQLFTWPTDQPRHATSSCSHPVETVRPRRIAENREPTARAEIGLPPRTIGRLTGEVNGAPAGPSPLIRVGHRGAPTLRLALAPHLRSDCRCPADWQSGGSAETYRREGSHQGQNCGSEAFPAENSHDPRGWRGGGSRAAPLARGLPLETDPAPGGVERSIRGCRWMGGTR